MKPCSDQAVSLSKEQVRGKEPKKQYSTSSFKRYHDICFPRVYPNEVQRDGGAPGTQGHLHSLVHLSRTHRRCVLRDSGQRESRCVYFSDCSQTDRQRDCLGCSQTKAQVSIAQTVHRAQARVSMAQTTGLGLHGTICFLFSFS